jgi:hypothetical protein
MKAFACPPGAIPVIGNIFEFAGPPYVYTKGLMNLLVLVLGQNIILQNISSDMFNGSCRNGAKWVSCG